MAKTHHIDEATLNDLHLWMFNNGYEHVWFEFETDLQAVEQ